MIDLIEKPIAAPARPASPGPAAARRTDAPPGPAPWAAETRALVTLATPLVLTQLAQMAIGTTDLVLLGRYSQSALAAVAIGNTVYWFAWLLGGGPASAVSPMIAHILGERAGNRGGVRASLRMGLWAVAIISLVVMPIMWSARPILLLLGQRPDLARGAGQFVSLVSIGLPFSLATMVLGGFSTTLGHPRSGLWVSLATIVFNAVAGWTLIFGHFGGPRLGLVGSGLATSASQVFGFLCMVAVVQRNPALRGYRIFHRFARPVRVKLAEVFRLGLPIGVTTLFEAMLFNAMTLLMGAYGPAALAAHQIAMNLSSITFMVPLGIGMASTVRVGLAAGAGDRAGARRAGLVALILAGGFMGVAGVLMAMFGPSLAGLYLGNGSAENAAVITLAARFLLFAAGFQLFDGVQVVGVRLLRGLKDARIPMVLAGASYWLVGAPVCVFLAVGLNMRGDGIWLGFVICLAVAAAALCARFLILTRGAAQG
jgi:MATE family multidrug resistance protein